MVGISSIKSALENEKFARFAAGAAGAVYTTTAIKATVRPAVTFTDKNSDIKTKKYTASKEFVYQIMCLAVAMSIVPFIRKGGFKVIQNKLKGLTSAEDLENLKNLYKSSLENKLKEATEKKKSERKLKAIKKSIEDIKNISLKKIEYKQFDGLFDAMKSATNINDKTKDIMHKVHGGEVLGEFVGSIFGLTILAPLLSMKVLHPVLSVFGLDEGKKK